MCLIFRILMILIRLFKKNYSNYVMKVSIFFLLSQQKYSGTTRRL